jgi:hypothetical protein
MSFILNPEIYWVFSSEVDRPDGSKAFPFTEWRMHPDNRPHVAFRKVRPHLDEDPRTEWILFEVSKPVLFTDDAAKGAGKPTIAPKGLNTEEEDVIQSPDVDAPSSFEVVDKLETFLKAAGTAGMFFLAWVIYDSFIKPRR